MNINQATEARNKLNTIVDELAVEIVRLSNLRKAAQQALSDVDVLINTEVSTQSLSAKIAVAKAPAKRAAVAAKTIEAVSTEAAKAVATKAAKAVKAVSAKAVKAVPAKAAKAVATKAAKAAKAVPATPTAFPDKPTLKQALMHVMGDKIMQTDMICDKLKEKGWLPNAKEPKLYVGHRLCQSKDLFMRVPAMGRGYYQVVPGAVMPTTKSPVRKAKAAPAAKAPATKAKAAPAAKTPKAKAAPAAKTPKNGKGDTEAAVLTEFGFSTAGNSSATP